LKLSREEKRSREARVKQKTGFIIKEEKEEEYPVQKKLKISE
jgi:hypothetical protein